MKFVIRWKSKVNGRAGKGTKEFGREEGEELVQELNREYPDIEHELIEAPAAHSEAASEPAHQEESSSSSEQAAHAAHHG